MELKIRVVFARRSSKLEDQSETLPLEWTLSPTPIALKYYKALQKVTATDYMYRRDRFYGFADTFFTEEYIRNELNKCIDIINSYHPNLITEKLEKDCDQEKMNQLHRYFEIYRGPILNPHKIYENGDVNLREAFDNFNLLIHRYEDGGFSKRNTEVESPKFYVNFGLSESAPRYPLEDEDYKHFGFEISFGSWVINYCEAGKPLHDIWRDDDANIGHEAILPLRYYSADGLITFGSETSKNEAKNKMAEFHSWWDKNSQALSELGFHKNDPKNSIGHIVVAELNRSHPIIKHLNEKEIVDLISNYQWVNKVECLDYTRV